MHFSYLLNAFLLARLLTLPMENAPLSRARLLWMLLIQSACLFLASEPFLGGMIVACVGGLVVWGQYLLEHWAAAWAERYREDPKAAEQSQGRFLERLSSAFYRHVFKMRLERAFHLIRLGSLGVLVIVAGVASSPAINMRFNAHTWSFLVWLSHWFGPLGWLTQADPARVSLVLMGMFLVMRETNLVLRLVLQKFGFLPLSASGKITLEGSADKETAKAAAILEKVVATKLDLQQGEARTLVQHFPVLARSFIQAASAKSEEGAKAGYDAGRLIGVLERLFIYGFLLRGDVVAISVVIAAKAFARFKELDKRQLAEYVLVGTMLSVLLTFLVAMPIRAQLSPPAPPVAVSPK